MLRRVALLALLSGLAACSHGGAVPSVPSSVQAPQRRDVLAKLLVKVPRPPRRHLGAHYVSPATASLAYAVDGGTPASVAIASSNPECQPVNSAGALECAIPIALSPGSHTLSFTAKDESGIALSADTDASIDVVPGADNAIRVTLGGIAASLAVLPVPGTLAVAGSQYSGFSVTGNAPQSFELIAVDADGNWIVGPGAPQPVIAATPASMTFATPAPSSPNVWPVTSIYRSAADPTTPARSSLSVTATPVPHSGGTTVRATIPLQLYQPWIYVADYEKNAVYAFDESGNEKTLVGSFSGITQYPQGLLYDPHDGVLYVASCNLATATGGNVLAFRLDGTAYALGSAAPFSGVTCPSGIAYDSKNGDIYITNYSKTGGSVQAFDEQGNAKSISGFAGVTAAYSIAYNANEDWFYVADCAPAAVQAYTSSGASQPLTGNHGAAFPGIQTPDAMTYDARNGWYYVDNCAPGTITAYDAQGNQQTLASTSQGIKTGWGIAFDPYDDLIYVANDTSSPPEVTIYNEAGILQSPGAFGSFTYPSGIAVVP